MCGIAGFMNGNGLEPDPETLRAMLEPMANRGPDGEGVRVEGAVALGHRRLAVIDLATGAQPLGNEDGTVWVTFNGEIFNYRELRKELTRAGHRFQTASDTEVLVHLYEEHGAEMVTRLDGFFAFALYDARKHTLMLARDRLGVKPLFYFRTEKVFAFASTVPALRAHPEFPRELDAAALWDFLSLQYLPEGTAYRNVRKLEGAELLEFDGETVRKRRYWRETDTPKLDISYPDACAELDKRVRKAVTDRLISDVPLGIFLSGGVDSAIVAGLAAEALDAPLRCYSIAFREKAYDEREAAAANAAWLRPFARKGLEHLVREVNPCDFAVLEKLIGEYGQPFADASLIPTFLLSAFAREEVTVALGGDGADELFRGYERYWVMRQLARLDFLPGALRAPLFRTLGALLPDTGGERGKIARLRRLLDGAGRSGAERYLAIVSHTGETLKREFAGPFFDGVRSTLEHFDIGELLAAGDAPAFDRLRYLPGDILVKADTASMAASLELRSPFLDYHTLEFAVSLPETFKESHGRRKRILCDTFARYLPPGAALRRKRGFGVPLADWFRNEWKKPLKERLLSGQGIQRGLFDPDGVEQLIAGHLAGHDFSYALYSILVLEMFLEHDQA